MLLLICVGEQMDEHCDHSSDQTVVRNHLTLEYFKSDATILQSLKPRQLGTIQHLHTKGPVTQRCQVISSFGDFGLKALDPEDLGDQSYR